MTAPQQRTIEEGVPAVATAGSSQSTNLADAPYDGTVSYVGYVPAAGVTGANTNTRQVQLVNRGQAGSGTTVVATLSFVSGTNGVANDEVTVPLSGTAGATTIAAGDVLQWQSNAVGTGQADPGGFARVTLDRSKGSVQDTTSHGTHR
jgi:hypothetical protein